MFTNGMKLCTVWSYTRPDRAGGEKVNHPTVKNAEMMQRLVELLTREGDMVCDPFMGSGTTAVACQNTARRFVGCELIPEYFELTESRLEKAKAKNQPTLCPVPQPA